MDCRAGGSGIGHGVLGLAVVAPFIALLFPIKQFASAPAQLFFEPFQPVVTPVIARGLDVTLLLPIGVALFAVVFAARVVRLAWLLRRAPVVHAIGRVRVVVAGDAPFSSRLLHAYVAVPQSTLADSRSLRFALAHEAEHHRQGDTFTLYL